MYIWTAIDVDDQLASIKQEAKRIEKVVLFKDSNITLPLHISLKISCPIPDDKYEDVVADVRNILKTCEQFVIQIKRIELHETIAWIMMESNEHLEGLHAELDTLFMEKYGVAPHRFDMDFAFHTTLFLDSDADKVKEAFLMIKDAELPPKLIVEKFVIGMSPEGKVGTYKVMEEIPLNKPFLEV